MTWLPYDLHPEYPPEGLPRERLLARYGEEGIARTRAFFADLTSEQWDRAGVHPEYGHFTMTNAVMQVGVHESVHIEQIAKILAQRV